MFRTLLQIINCITLIYGGLFLWITYLLSSFIAILNLNTNGHSEFLARGDSSWKLILLFLLTNFLLVLVVKSIRQTKITSLSIFCPIFIILLGIYSFHDLFSGFDGISKEEQNLAIDFCKNLHAHTAENNFQGIMTYDELPKHFQAISPDAVFGPKFAFKATKNDSTCCFKSTKDGNPDNGYVDCYKQTGTNSELLPSIAIVYSGEQPDCKGVVVSFQKKKECTNLKL